VNFTREPIIETIITPKEGSKLVIRSSKAEGQEEYLVDAVEVVSFGQALCFRCTEKPKPFLVPVGDYEVVETKESRMVLKNAQFDRTIKIGGGREAPIRREAPERDEEEPIPAHFQEDDAEAPAPAAGGEQRFEQRRREGGRGRDRDRDRGRHRRRRSHEEREEMRAEVTQGEPSQEQQPAAPKPQQEGSSAQVFTALIPPPTTLISDTIARYKDMITPAEPKPAEEPKKEEPKKPEEGEGSSLSRSVVSEADPMHTSNFAPLSDWTNFLS